MVFSVDKCMCHSKTSLYCSVTFCFCLWVPNFFILWCVFTLVVFFNVYPFYTAMMLLHMRRNTVPLGLVAEKSKPHCCLDTWHLEPIFFFNNTCHPALYNWNTVHGKDKKFPSLHIILNWSGDSYNQWIDLNQKIIHFWGGYTVFFVTVLQVMYITLSHKL